eukprot:Gb_08623 [translate_table: standard]
MPFAVLIQRFLRTRPQRTLMLRPGLEPHLPCSANTSLNTRLSWLCNSGGYYRFGSLRFVKGRQYVTFCALADFVASSGVKESVTRKNKTGVALRQDYLPFTQQSREFGRYALEQYSDDDYDTAETENTKVSSTIANIDEWKWRLSMFLRNKEEQEMISKEKKDRRDYEQIAAVAARMGLYSQQYAKVVVVSKVPLPNYRPDLDDKRPQREVVIPPGLQRRVESLLQQHLDKKRLNAGQFLGAGISGARDTGSLNPNEDGLLEQNDHKTPDSTVLQNILQRRSLRIRNMQRAWQETPEGQKMLEFRRTLPAYKEKEALLTAVAKNQVIVVSGETGCGKTTQLPQYILESEIESGRGAVCSIICTQPRRISAMAVSERVAAERGEQMGESVGYKVRLEGIRGKSTRLLFCTTGILLRRLLVDRELKGVSHVVVDEIHERGMNEDFLLIVLKDLLPRRPDLRLILMSATLNAELFSSFFGGAPMIHIPGFTHPVRAHFLENILEMTGYRLTSFNQMDDYGQDKMWKMQKQALRKRKSQLATLVEDALVNANFDKYSSRTRESLSCWNADCIGFNLIEAILCHICRKERPGAVLVFMTGWDDINSLKDQLMAHPLLGDPNRVLLLACHGSMASSEQKLIFVKPPPNVRKIVLATNMAETSITINDVVFVVDCGKAKETSYDALNNTPCLLPSWISQASARQRRGRAGRVQPGECYHLYPRCLYDAFAEYQLPELLRTPLQSLCLQIKSLKLGSIVEFLSRALQPPEPLSVQNAVEYLKLIGALDDKENLTNLGHHLSMLPVDPKLGKMLIMGAVFRCLDPILTIAAGLSVRDPFLLPHDKKDLADAAKTRFSAKDYSDHMALVRAYEGWKDAERAGSTYEYCWRNFLSAQTLQAIHSLRKQFSFLLKDSGLVDDDASTFNHLSHNQSLVRAVICAGLFPGIVSVVHREKSIAMKTMEDGQVNLYANSVNAREQKIPCPWLVFNEKVKVNSVFIRDSTGISDSILLLFGGALTRGDGDGHLKMLEGFLEFFMQPDLAETYLKLKEELDVLIQKKLENPSIDIHKAGQHLLLAVQELVSADQCNGRFIFGREVKKPKVSRPDPFSKDGQNPKSLLQTLIARAGHGQPQYKVKHLKTNEFRALVEFNGMQFVGKPCSNKKLAEKDAAIEALGWLTGTSGTVSSLAANNNLAVLLKKDKKREKRLKGAN